MNLSTTINPIREDGDMDHRFTGLTNEIVRRAGMECIEDLSDPYQYTNDAEARYEKAGLTLVTSFFFESIWKSGNAGPSYSDCVCGSRK